ncbi:delta-12 fatty acid desaturase [Martensiomyces pterosporus]|nr:delta-12 fatty acid desaturase [Martensiomyces pterosporus]
MGAKQANPEEGYELSNFTIKELRSCVPKHCFERDTLRSFSYVVYDLCGIAFLGICATYIHHLPLYLRALAWLAYWVCQGVVCTGIWVLAHECGHGSFSDSKTVNNVTGWVLHSALLVPYYSWRRTHSQHHKNANNINRDEVFVPRTKSALGLQGKSSTPAWVTDSIFEETPIYVIYQVAAQSLFGWPLYLYRNASGPKYARGASHFNPKAVIFRPHHFWQIVISDIGVLITIGAITYASWIFSPMTVFFYYGVPYLMVNFWLVTITFLQHTHAALPHYDDDSWNFIRGALSTIDRDFGWILNICLHHIHDTHVAHHIFSQMPHYHAEEATEHLKKVLGKYYHFSDKNPLQSLYDTMKHCQFIEDTGSIRFFRNTSVPTKPYDS